MKIFCFLIALRYFARSLAAYESLVIYKSLVKHRTFVLLSSFVLLGSFVFLDSFVLYGFLSYLRFLKCFSYFSFVDVSILPYLSLFVIWQSEHIFDCIFIYFLFYEYITPIPARKSQLSPEVEELCKSGGKEVRNSYHFQNQFLLAVNISIRIPASSGSRSLEQSSPAIRTGSDCRRTDAMIFSFKVKEISACCRKSRTRCST